MNIMKFGDSNIIGYVFKIIDSLSKRNNANFNQETCIPNSKKEILFDLLSLNYIRTEIVSEKIGLKKLRENENNIDNENQMRKSYRDKKITNISNRDDIIESSYEEIKNITIELSKEKIMELQTKDYRDIENFIYHLP